MDAPARHRPRRRVALYSHDTQGLGHIRRNLAIAATLVEADPSIDVLLLTGAPEATHLPRPAHTEVVTLPSLHKDVAGGYSARSLGLGLHDLLDLRGHIIAATLTAFQPDVFIVDKVARGVHGELDPALRALRAIGTRIVLGIRDILDSPEVTSREWRTTRTTQAVAEFYDQVWVYGDPTVYDAATAYGWPKTVRDKVVYTGYLAPRPGPVVPRDAPVPSPFVLCLVGGGQDGGDLADAFSRSRLPRGHHGVLITGPYMASRRRRGLLDTAEARPDLSVLEFTPHIQDYVAQARAVVTMGGYNSVCELLAAGHPTLVLPRTRPRMEQALRAEVLSHLGWVDVLSANELEPQAISAWLTDAVQARPRARQPLDLDGLGRIPWLADTLLTAHPLEVDDHAAI